MLGVQVPRPEYIAMWERAINGTKTNIASGMVSTAARNRLTQFAKKWPSSRAEQLKHREHATGVSLFDET
jgi:hypothetical protein